MKATLIAVSSAALLIESAFAQAGGRARGGGGAGAAAPARPLVVQGELQPASQTDVKGQVRARVEKVHVREGDAVKAGALLIELYNPRVDDQSLLRILAPRDGTV